MSLNKVMLIGNVGRDPEVRYLDKDRVVCSFSLATSETYSDRTTGEKRTDTEWHRIEMWDNLAKIAEKYVRKGNQVFIEGKIRTESWKDKEGNERTGIKIRATAMTLLGGNRQSDLRDEPVSGKPQAEDRYATPPPTAENGTISSTPDDDLPF